jgi:flagellar hook-associated protein 2
MGKIQSNVGLISGIDIQKTVNQLLSVAGQPRDLLQTRIKGYQSQQVAINELTALTIGIQLQTDRLGKATNLATTTPSSSKPDIVAVATTGTPVPGNYSVQTLQTAQTATAASSPFTSSTDTLQSGDFVVRSGGFVDSSASVDDLRGGAGIARGKIRITDRSGTSREIDLRFASSTDDVLKAINTSSGLRVSAKTSGDRIVLSDLTGQSVSNLVVEEVGDGRTAADLGLSGVNVASTSATGEDIQFLSSATRLSTLLDNRGVAFTSGNDLSVTLRDGTSLSLDANATKNPTSVGQLLSTINAANSSKLEARIKADGSGFELIDKTTGSGTFAATGKLADQLGFTGTDGTSGTISGTRVQGTLQGPLLSTLKGGQGIGTPGSISVTNRSGTTTSINLSTAVSLRDVVDQINSASAGVTASLNKSRTGIVLQDVTGSTSGNLIVSDGDTNNTATKLGIAANVASNSVDSKSLGLQYISEATELSKLNQGRGVSLGSFSLTNAAGATSAVNLLQNGAKTVGDVIKAINSTSIGIQAKLNDGGDGIALVDTSGGTGSLTITDATNGTTARDLGIAGTGKVLTNPARQQIDGSQAFKLTLMGTETLSEVADKINAANGPLTASLLTSGPSTVRLLFTSRASGEIGRIVAEGDGVGLNINASGVGRDAIISVGTTGDLGGTIVRSSNNTFNDVINGISLTTKGVDTSPVDINIATTNSNIQKNLQLFVDQYNKVRDKIDKETAFDATTKTSGQLFGSSEVLRVEQALSRFISQKTFASGKIQSLEQLGVSLDDTGKLRLDSTKLGKAVDNNLGDVQAFLTNTKTGFSDRAKVVLDNLVGAKNSVLVNRSQALQRNIETSTDRVTSLTARLDSEQQRLLKQFYDLETNLSKIKSNGSALSSIGVTTAA